MGDIIVHISGMTCGSCEKILEDSLNVYGVKKVRASYEKSALRIKFDENKISKEEIFSIISENGYTPNDKKTKKSKLYLSIALGLGFLLFGAYILIKNTMGFDFFPDLTQKTSLLLLFFLGLLTGFHCISMCGGFVISYAAKAKSKVRAHLEYGVGKTVGYALVGGLFGLFGSFIAFTPQIRGYAAIIAGLFLIIFGLNMLNIFPWLRKIIIKPPKFLNKYTVSAHKSKNPLKIGLLNSLLIACGPLQAMYIYAAATGDFFQGALSLAVFGLGTLPALLSFGVVASMISAGSTKKILKVSAIVVILLGVVMLNRGLALTGNGYDVNSLVTGVTVGDNYDEFLSNEVAIIHGGYQEINMEVNGNGWSPDKFVLQKGIPVRWRINGEEINGCNNAIQVPEYNLNFDIGYGEQLIEFTPNESGNVAWSCWMGMIPGTFIVVDDLGTLDQEQVNEINNFQTPKGGSCGGNSGSCGGNGGGCGCGCGG
jgi:sulfite exporter TauE/SafE/copper chaperone CopZ